MTESERNHRGLGALASAVGAAAVRAGSRDEVERSVTEAATDGPVRFAWIRRQADPVGATATAGDGRFLEGVETGSDPPEPWQTAIEDHSVVVLDPEDAGDDWSQTASEAGARSIAVVPLRGEDALHGVLTLYAEDGDAFGDPTPISEVGDVVGRALDSHQDREELRTKLQEARSLAEVVERSPDRIAIKDRKGRYQWVNDRFLAQFGLERSAVLGTTDEAIFDPEDATRFRTADRSVLDSGATETREERVTVDGREYVFDTTRIPRYEDGAVIGTATTRRDVTDRVQRERELRERNERLETFASVVSHDLRNPLDIAEGYVGKARQTGAEEDFDEIASAIERSKSIIDELLTLARADRQLNETEAVELAAVATAAWKGVDTDAATIDVTSERTVTADEGQLKRIFENLFRNSVEHGTSGGDGVTVRVVDTDEGFFVADDGPGIPEAKRAEALEPGYTTATDGTGLGLAIVGRIAEAHGWSVGLSESRDGGVRIDVDLGE